MELTIGCPYCQKTFRVSENAFGRQVECSACGKRFTVPDPRPQQREEPPMAIPTGPSASEPPMAIPTTPAPAPASADPFANLPHADLSKEPPAPEQAASPAGPAASGEGLGYGPAPDREVARRGGGGAFWIVGGLFLLCVFACCGGGLLLLPSFDKEETADGSNTSGGGGSSPSTPSTPTPARTTPPRSVSPATAPRLPASSPTDFSRLLSGVFRAPSATASEEADVFVPAITESNHRVLSWSLEPDPPENMPSIAANTLAGLPPISSPHTTEYAVPDVPSPMFVVVKRDFNASGVAIVDAQDGTTPYTAPLPETAKASSTSAKIWAVSPDGTMVATQSGSNKIGMLDLAAKRSLGETANNHDDPTAPTALYFPRNDRLLSIHRHRNRNFSPLAPQVDMLELVLVDPRKQKRIASMQCEVSQRQTDAYDFAAISPGGKYIAVCSDSGVRVWASEDGEEVAGIRLPRYSEGIQKLGIAFNHAGTELALFVEETSNRERTLVTWDLATAKPTYYALGDRFETTDRSYLREANAPCPSLMPGPAGCWIVLRAGIIDPATRSLVERFQTDSFPQRPLSPTCMLDAETGIGSIGNTPRLEIKFYGQEFADRVAAVRDAGTINAIKATKLTSVDVANARYLNMQPVAAGWRASADPGPAARTLPTNVKYPLGRDVRDLMISDDQRCFVTLSDSADANTESQDSGFLSWFNLENGTGLSRIPLAWWADLKDVSPSGNRVVLTAANNYERQQAPDRFFAVYEQGQKEAIATWVPYPNGSESQPGMIDNAWAAFVDEEHVMTLDRQNVLVLWKLPECRAVWVMNEVSHVPALSPGRKYFLCEMDQASSPLLVFECLTGDYKGTLSPDVSLSLQYGVFADNGSKVIAWRSFNSDCFTFDFNTGAVASEHQVSDLNHQRHLLFETKDSRLVVDMNTRQNGYISLFDLNEQYRQWEYRMPKGAVVASGSSPDGRLWLAMPTNAPASKVLAPDSQTQPSQAEPMSFVLIAREVPTDREADVISKRSKEVVPAKVSKGEQVRIVVSGAPSGLEQQFTNDLRRMATQAGLRVSDSGKYRLELTGSIRNTGETLHFESRSGSRRTYEADEKVADFRLRLVGPSGTLFNRDISTNNQAFMVETHMFERLQTTLDDRMENGLASRVKAAQLPTDLFESKAIRQVWGKTIIGIDN